MGFGKLFFKFQNEEMEDGAWPKGGHAKMRSCMCLP